MNPKSQFLSEEEGLALLEKLFPSGLAGADVHEVLCPGGWETSPFFPAFHPTPEQCYQETIEQLNNLNSLFSGKTPPRPLPTWLEFLHEHEESQRKKQAIDPLEELTDLVGLCLWDIISDNQDLVDPEGKRIHYPSFRATSALIDQFATQNQGLDNDYYFGDHMRFYLGSGLVGHRVDLTPVYELIFKRLKKLAYRWCYSFPEIHLIDFGGTHKASDAPYSPSESLSRQEEQKNFAKKLKDDTKERKTRAWDQAPPTTVQAYQNVFNSDPVGWPPT